MANYQKYAAFFLAGAFCLSCVKQCLQTFPVSVRADNDDGRKQVVIIGDGISTRAGLAQGELSYPEILENTTEIVVQNFAQEAYTTDQILSCLENPEIQEALAQADLILVTAGIHDIMTPFIDKAHEFMDEFGFVYFEDIFSANLADYGIEDETELLYYANQLTNAAKQNRDPAEENLKKITENLLQYENANIVFQTVYNNLNTIRNYRKLSLKRKQAYNSISNPVTTVVEKAFNEHLRTLAEEHENVQVVDTFTLFQGKAYLYVNLDDLDIHPNAKGHSKIADTIIEVTGLERKEGSDPVMTETTTEAISTTTSLETPTTATSSETTNMTTMNEVASDTTTTTMSEIVSDISTTTMNEVVSDISTTTMSEVVSDISTT
ncbi:MAG: hypothetical protein K2J71_04250, partial [Oscillospiraceae bacterium]|nr:hypothetical protein [Oscillospiraceae bacterium]